jgi:hypothetical protein
MSIFRFPIHFYPPSCPWSEKFINFSVSGWHTNINRNPRIGNFLSKACIYVVAFDSISGSKKHFSKLIHDLNLILWLINQSSWPQEISKKLKFTLKYALVRIPVRATNLTPGFPHSSEAVQTPKTLKIKLVASKLASCPVTKGIAQNRTKRSRYRDATKKQPARQLHSRLKSR